MSLVANNGASLTAGKVGNACTTGQVLQDAAPSFSIQDDPSLNPGSGSFTLEAWVNASTANSFGHAFIHSGFVEQSFSVFSITQSENGTWFAELSDGSRVVSDNGNFSNVLVVPGPAVEPNSWHHIALVLDRDATTVAPPSDFLSDFLEGSAFPAAILYYDGAEYSRIDISNLGSVNPSGSNAAIGAGFRGSVDELALYNSALSAEQIAQVFTAQTAGKGKVDSDHDGCSDCRDSACNVNNLETKVSYQGNFVSNPIFAANAATADLLRMNNPNLRVAVKTKFVSNDYQTGLIDSQVFHFLGRNANLPIFDPPTSNACQDCAVANGVPYPIADHSDFCKNITVPSFACGACCPVVFSGTINCQASQPLGLGCKEMTRAEIIAGGTCTDFTTHLPLSVCCPYPPNSSSVTGPRIYISDADGCCIRTGGCKWDSTVTDSITDACVHNYKYDQDKPTCP